MFKKPSRNNYLQGYLSYFGEDIFLHFVHAKGPYSCVLFRTVLYPIGLTRNSRLGNDIWSETLIKSASTGLISVYFDLTKRSPKAYARLTLLGRRRVKQLMR